MNGKQQVDTRAARIVFAVIVAAPVVIAALIALYMLAPVLAGAH